MPDHIIELSVEETNQLRETLGLPSLRQDGGSKPTTATQHKNSSNATTPNNTTNSGGGKQAEVIELSVHETNALREKLGLPPLKQNRSETEVVDISKQLEAEASSKEATERIEKARLERQVKAGIAQFAKNSIANEQDGDVTSWAQSMLKQKAARQEVDKTKAKRDKKAEYSEKDLVGLRVAHSAAELHEGSVTVMTLADSAILDTDENSKKVLGLKDDDEQLENIDLIDQRTVSDGLKAKRKMELGMGRAGGYAGYDDDEFEELGGALGPSKLSRGLKENDGKEQRLKGFQIGATLGEYEDEENTDLFAQYHKPVSLETKQDVAASDFMTIEEEEAERASKKHKKKEPKFKKQKSRKEKKKTKRQVESDDEQENEVHPDQASGLGLLTELEETAPEDMPELRKRRRTQDKEDVSSEAVLDQSVKSSNVTMRNKFDTIMAKANERTKAAFSVKPNPMHVDADEEPDDAFLNEALARARRLNKLKQMAGTKDKVHGADAVAAIIHANGTPAPPLPVDEQSSGTIMFYVDETREFTRALQARAEQSDRKQAKAKIDDTGIKEQKNEPLSVEEMEDGVDMMELAKDVTEDPMESNDNGLDGESVLVGRGVGSVLGLLKQTGDLTRRNAGREEMRGRAKDKKTYEDYEALDLSQVVKIGDNATEKDKDFASREIKLEYRDKNGRLLTRKEAFRELCYQFHGHGSGKRKEEKRSTQIAREQAEARVASQQAAEGTFGALKATQKATGKAFVVHKT
jgi:U4/U6.U5 tri-snRNP-associated protein 1